MPRIHFTLPQSSPWFLVQVTGTGGGGYTFQEGWLNASGTFEPKVNGRFGNSLNPGYAVNTYTFATDEIALCRSADLAGGLVWELAPLSGGGSSSLTVTDGTNTVSNTTQITFSGATVGGTSPNATVAVSGGGALTYGSTALPATYPVTSRAAWSDTGLSVTLPSAGTYLLTGQVFANLHSAPGTNVTYIAYASARLYDDTAGGGVPNSDTLVAQVYGGGGATGSVGNANINSSVPTCVLYTVSQATVIDLQVYLTDTEDIISPSGGFTVYNLAGFGSTVLSWVRLGS